MRRPVIGTPGRQTAVNPTLKELTEWFAEMGRGAQCVSPGTETWDGPIQNPPVRPVTWKRYCLYSLAESLHWVLNEAEAGMVDETSPEDARDIAKSCVELTRLLCKDLARGLRRRTRSLDAETLVLVTQACGVGTTHGFITRRAMQKHADRGYKSLLDRREGANARRHPMPYGEELEAEVRAYRLDNPHVSQTAAEDRIATRHGGEGSTVRRRLKALKAERRKG